MLITTTRRHLCLIFLKTAGAILLFQVARANWPATRTKLTTNTFQVKISKYKLKISLLDQQWKKKKYQHEQKLSPPCLSCDMACHAATAWATYMILLKNQYLQRPRNLNVLWDIWDIWWVKNWVLDNGGPKVLAILDWYSSKSHQIKSTHPPRVGRLQHAV